MRAINKKIIFIGGIHGVGKTTLCQSLSKKLLLPHYSASILIKSRNAQAIQDGTKNVANVSDNQNILMAAINSLSDPVFILDGHFTIPNREGILETVSTEFFMQLSPAMIILLTEKPHVIAERVLSRDQKVKPVKDIQAHQDLELMQAQVVSKRLSLQLVTVSSEEISTETVLDACKKIINT